MFKRSYNDSIQHSHNTYHIAVKHILWQIALNRLRSYESDFERARAHTHMYIAHVVRLKCKEDKPTYIDGSIYVRTRTQKIKVISVHMQNDRSERHESAELIPTLAKPHK